MTEIKITQKQQRELFYKALFGSPFFTIVASVLTTFLVGMAFARVGGGVPISVTQTTTETKSTFDVTGEGEAVVMPDEARISLGVEETASTVDVAQERVDMKMRALQDGLKDLGVEKQDIQTESYHVSPNYSNSSKYPEYDYQRGGRDKVVGYRVSSRVEVKFTDFSVINQAISKAGELGLNQVGQLSFGLSDQAEDKGLSIAREKAVSKAKSKAKELAKLAGVNLGKVVNVEEALHGNYQPRPMYEVMDKAVGGEEEIIPQIEPGTEKVSVSVTLSYTTE